MQFSQSIQIKISKATLDTECHSEVKCNPINNRISRKQTNLFKENLPCKDI